MIEDELVKLRRVRDNILKANLDSELKARLLSRIEEAICLKSNEMTAVG